jgi:hypothetical protein
VFFWSLWIAETVDAGVEMLLQILVLREATLAVRALERVVLLLQFCVCVSVSVEFRDSTDKHTLVLVWVCVRVAIVLHHTL